MKRGALTLKRGAMVLRVSDSTSFLALPDFIGEPLQLPDLPNPRHNFIEEEGLSLPHEPQGFFAQTHQAAQSGFREGAVMVCLK